MNSRSVSAALVALWLTTTAGVAGRAAPAASPRSGAPRISCAQLTTLKFPDVTVSEAVAVTAASTGAVRAAHCRVSGVIGSEIRFTVLLPDSWNGRFVMGGGGGFVGSVQNSAQSTLNQGYATAGTDTGHQASGVDASWALNNIERRVNFGYLAVHRTTDVSKAIIAAYYGTDSTKNYFMGCSRGGGQGVMEAIRYPDDFDGVIAGAPALDWTGIGAQFIKDAQAAFPDAQSLKTPPLSPDVMKGVATRILEACDLLDGVKDGVMDDPRRCKVDLKDAPLTEPQRTALQKIYDPTVVLGETIAPGQPFGGEGEAAGWQAWITGPNPQGAATNQPSLRFAFGTELFKYFVFNDPSWDYTTYDFTTFKKDTALVASYLNATNPDLSGFRSKGHKILLWHGWADAALSPLRTIQYFDDVKAHDPDTDTFMRLFLLPGVLHCGGGAGPDKVDWMTVLADWVEKGSAPDRVLATSTAPNGDVLRTRPLCRYPQHAEYKGSGSTDDASSFVCR